MFPPLALFLYYKCISSKNSPKSLNIVLSAYGIFILCHKSSSIFSQFNMTP